MSHANDFFMNASHCQNRLDFQTLVLADANRREKVQ